MEWKKTIFKDKNGKAIFIGMTLEDERGGRLIVEEKEHLIRIPAMGADGTERIYGFKTEEDYGFHLSKCAIVPAFGYGDRVKIIHTPLTNWISKDELDKLLHFSGKKKWPYTLHQDSRDKNLYWYTMDEKLIGREAIINDVFFGRNDVFPRYSVKDVPEKYAWYTENQFELIKKK